MAWGSPAIRATASPRNRAKSSARAGWSAKAGMTPKRFLPGNVGGGEHPADAGGLFDRTLRGRRRRSARGDAGERIDPHRQRIAGKLSPPNLSAPVTLATPSSRIGERSRLRPFREGRGSRAATRTAPIFARGVHDGRDDLAIAGAAAQDAAERVLDPGPRPAADLAPEARSRRLSRPGVQMPHCAAPCARKDACRRRQPAVGKAFDRAHRAARDLADRRSRQAQTGAPSSSTVQAPQSPASQPTLVPVSRKMVAQHRRKPCDGMDGYAYRRAVDLEGNAGAGRVHAATIEAAPAEPRPPPSRRAE